MSFGNLSALRNLMFQTALSIHGSGWVWLVVSQSSGLRVLATYNAGTPFNLKARQTQDPNTSWNLDTIRHSQQTAGMRANRRHEYLILPILGLNVWEHAYVTDYGVNGKQQYLKNWWSAINWHRVNTATIRTTQEVQSEN
jgi:superoxide dismutase, Fe-Mn family